MTGQPQGSSSSRIEVTLSLDSGDRTRLRRLAMLFNQLAKLDEDLEIAGIHYQLVPERLEMLECYRLEKEIEVLQSHIQSTFSTSPSSP